MTKDELKRVFEPVIDTLLDNIYKSMQQLENSGVSTEDIEKFFRLQSDTLISQISSVDVAGLVNKLKEGLNGTTKL